MIKKQMNAEQFVEWLKKFGVEGGFRLNGKAVDYRYERRKIVEYRGNCSAYGVYNEWTVKQFLTEFANKKFTV